ncbi:hypothetical protein Z517_03023 [Fonsecaea pedrosoi CBS 271.37]|uniref:BTB domain-containing protein n=1 Tax=Fonsecaea pedrosoi CBS 271.37 TaxID=1442368 RepID=A0A0D2FAW5_9EURO|nr:uncharacterized protein Z517_03023 [Fonsecaea pedrosoi CBS 271.37]KIW83777.1 hypothetical protein Z517_03023 [Fonsecaea pedrosoi CBS 271.37]
MNPDNVPDSAMASSSTPPLDWDLSDRLVTTTQPQTYEVAADGDAYFRALTETKDHVLIRVSTEALSRNTKFFREQFKASWAPEGGKFTAENPLHFLERLEPFVLFLHVASEDDPLPPENTCLLRDVALMLDKYLFEGKLPAWFETILTSFIPKSFPFPNNVESSSMVYGDTGILLCTALPAILHSAYLLNLPALFATASRRMMWQMTAYDVDELLPDHMKALMPWDFIRGFESEVVRVRDVLISNLPHVFYPDPHGDAQWGCHDCNLVSHAERWHHEVISKAECTQAERLGGEVQQSLESIFAEYVHDMTKLERLREFDQVDNPTRFECGRFRLRHLDVSENEILFEAYTAIGGLCLPCIRAGGEFAFRLHCDQHNLDLSKESSVRNK